MTQTLTSVRAKPRLRREEGDTLHERKLASEHISVMLKEAITLLDPQKGDVVVDATLGLGGHSEAMLKSPGVRVFSFDADEGAVAAGKERLKKYGSRLTLLNANFGDMGEVLESAGVTKINKALFDLGWNKGQLTSGRGFSFLVDEPLNMSYGKKPASGFTAAEILNSWTEKVLADVFFGYGEERFARRIAKAVVARREIKPFETTLEFVETIRDSVPRVYRHGRLHFATKSFQALRIAVNDELGALERGLRAAWRLLLPQGRMVVISFHSIEDRLVKKTFMVLAKKDATLLTKKPLSATRSEIITNPSARSAKMRGLQKTIN